MIFTPPTPKHISMSMRWMNQINLWGPVCETLFYWLQQTPEGFWSANSQPLAGLWLPQLDHLHLQPEACASERTWGSLPLTMARSPLRSWKPTSWWHCWHFLLQSQPAFRAVEEKKKKVSSEMISNHSKIKTLWQRSRAKCYHLLVSGPVIMTLKLSCAPLSSN